MLNTRHFPGSHRRPEGCRLAPRGDRCPQCPEPKLCFRACRALVPERCWEVACWQDPWQTEHTSLPPDVAKPRALLPSLLPWPGSSPAGTRIGKRLEHTFHCGHTRRSAAGHTRPLCKFDSHLVTARPHPGTPPQTQHPLLTSQGLTGSPRAAQAPGRAPLVPLSLGAGAQWSPRNPRVEGAHHHELPDL